MADWKVPGAALAVVQDGKVALAKAYGQRDVEANLPVTTATQFLICSITKSFTATGMALLHNEGRLDWTKPVRDYMPEFRLHDAVATDRVTVRDLLCHQSGFGGAINTSVADLASWMRLHLGKGEFDGERLLPAALIGELHAPRVYNTVPGFAEFGEAHYGLGFQSLSYRGDRIVSHGGGWPGWGTLMTLVPDFGIGVAVFTNCSPSEVPQTLTWYVIDRLRGREPIEWRERFRKRREEMIAQTEVDKKAREKAQHPNTRPGHDLAAYAGDYENPAYGVMSIKEQGGALHWSWRGMFATMGHRHFETFELPEVPDRLLPDRLAITFSTDREGDIVNLSAPLEPMVKDIVFKRLAAGDCTDAAFRARCVGSFKGGPTTHRVTLDAEGQLVLKPDHQPAYRLAPQQGRRFRIVELEGFVVEFRGEGTVVDEVIFHQPNGTFVAKRVEG